MFRKDHTVSILAAWEEGEMPLDRLVNRYFRSHKSIGSKDRKAIGDAVYGIIRWKGLIDYFLDKPTWEARFDKWPELTPEEWIGRVPPHIACSFPKPIFDHLVHHYGEERAFELCWASNQPAPVTIRVNTLKTTREELLQKLGGKPCKLSDVGITFEGRPQLIDTPEYRAGLFELQDEGSQMIADLVQGKSILDYCAGAGGKSLAIAARMHNRGQLYLHDIRKSALYQARKRLKRAGVQNYQLIFPGDPKLQKLRVDCVLLDVPCSGSGTWRRNPDQKWVFRIEELPAYVQRQKHIVSEASNLGKQMVYATCSIFPEENWVTGDPTFQSFPPQTDGFYGSIVAQQTR